MWMVHTIPFHYVCDKGLSFHEQFHVCNSAQLSAYHKSTGAFYEPPTSATREVIHPEALTYNKWL